MEMYMAKSNQSLFRKVKKARKIELKSIIFYCINVSNYYLQESVLY